MEPHFESGVANKKERERMWEYVDKQEEAVMLAGYGYQWNLSGWLGWVLTQTSIYWT